MTIVEAEVMQVPVIATNVGGTSETMIDGKTGFLVNQGDIEEIERKITLLLNDKDFSKQMGKMKEEDLLQKILVGKIQLRNLFKI